VYTVNATDLKNRLGPILDRAELGPVAVMRHGRVVAYLTPAKPRPQRLSKRRAGQRSSGLSRADEERLVRLCASADLRPSRWARAGDRELMAGVATMLASQPEFDRPRLLALAERLWPGMTSTEGFAQWLARAPMDPSRLLPRVRAELARRR
jgi:prevent-host-death family protein